jgi:Transglutaminase-like superfamily
MQGRTKHWLRGLKWVLIVALALYALPFCLYLFSNANTRSFMQEQLVYKHLVDSLTQPAQSDSAKAIAIYTFVAGHLQQPTGAAPAYQRPIDVYYGKTASCDQQVWLLMHLLRAADIKALMMFLYGADSVSHHTVAAVELSPGRYAMLDPFYKLYFIDGSVRLASVGDIMKGNVKAVGVVPPDYFKLYETKYPFKYHSDNTLNPSRRFVSGLLWAYSKVLGRSFTEVFRAMHN